MKRALTFFLATCSLGLMAQQTYEGPAAARRFPGADVLRYDQHSGQLNYVRLSPEAQQPLHALKESPLFRRHWGQHDLVPFKTFEDARGMRHTRMQAYHAGRPIEAAVAVVHEAQGRVTAINGELPAANGFSGQALLSEQAAKAQAVAHIGARQYMWQIPGVDNFLRAHTGDPQATYAPAGELVYVPAKGDFESGKYRLAWKFDIYATAPISRDYVFVDAEHGNVIWKYSRIHTADVPGTAATAYSGTKPLVADQTGPNNYRLRESGRGGGILTYNCQQTTNTANPADFTDADNNWNNVNAQFDQYAPDCHIGIEHTYDYFKNTYNWNSVDNLGMPLVSYLHYDIGFDNAFWDGSSMTFGDGSGAFFSSPLTTPDVVAHEMTHGVTEFSAGLIYANESGAMNEAYSDIFGKTVEAIMQPSTWNWIVGYQCTPGNVGIRDMENPNNFQNPDTYGGLYWVPGADVHYNSAIGNKWYQILVDGESGTNDLGNAYNVTGLGFVKAAAIAFRNLTVYLTPSSDYADVRFYAIESARDLYGACSMEQIQTANAWYAVGLGALTTNQPVVAFNAGYPNSCSAPATFHFQNNSSIGQGYFWDFGDGSTSTLPNPSHTYTTYGNFTVKLVVTGCTGIQDSLLRVQYIHVDSTLPCAVAMPVTGADTMTECQGGLLDPGGYNNYPDGSFASTLIDVPNALYLTLNFTAFELEDFSDYIIIYDGNSNMSPMIGFFTGSTLPNGGTITTTSSQAFIEFSSDFGGNRPGFAMFWECTPVTAPPVAAFQATPTSTCDGWVQFHDVTTQGVTSWAWDFGDGTTSSQHEPTHQFPGNGTYTVTLVVCNIIGCDTLVLNNYITVNNTGVCTVSMPSGSSSNSTACQGILLDPGGYFDYSDFENSSYVIQPAGATSIVMDFTQFDLEFSYDFLYIYDGPTVGSPLIGVYTGPTLPNGGTVTTTSGSATLVFTTDGSVVAPGFTMDWHAINAQNGAVADFSAPLTAPVATAVNFTDQSTGAATYLWTFGDGATSTLANPNHSYATTGAYTVTLHVEDAAGCIGEYSQNIYIGIVSTADPLADNFRVWPNPSNGLLEVEASTAGTESTRIVVLNAVGQQVYAEVCAPGTTLRRSLDLRHIANGMYFVRLETSVGNSVHKVVIDHEAR